jgi:group I intron endonuclease
MMKKSISGIYQIKNTVTGKVYVGSSADTWQRRENHITLLKNNKHYNSRMQSDFSLYGLEAFEFSVIEECPRNALVIREQYYIANLLPEYNFIKKATRGDVLISEKQIADMRQMRQDRFTLDDIGAKYDISRQRVQQILGKSKRGPTK